MQCYIVSVDMSKHLIALAAGACDHVFAMLTLLKASGLELTHQFVEWYANSGATSLVKTHQLVLDRM